MWWPCIKILIKGRSSSSYAHTVAADGTQLGMARECPYNGQLLCEDFV